MVATLRHRHRVARPADDERGPHSRSIRHRVIGNPLQRHRLASPPGLVLRDEHLAAHVVHPVREGVRREAPEDDRVRCAEARAGEHRHGELGHHPHVDRNRGALADADLLQRIRHPHHIALQLGVGDRARVTRRLAFPVIRDPVTEARLDVTVDAVVGDVQLAAQVPLRVRQLPAVQLTERLEPCHALAPVALPERLERLVVDLRPRVRLRRERRCRREAALLVLQRLDRVVAHEAAPASRSYGNRVSTSQPSSVTSTRSSSRTPPIAGS